LHSSNPMIHVCREMLVVCECGCIRQECYHSFHDALCKYIPFIHTHVYVYVYIYICHTKMRCAIIPCTHSPTPSFHDVLCNYSFHDVLCIRQECYHSFHDVLCSYSFHDVLCIRQECSHSFHDVLCNYSLHGCIRQECYHSFHSHHMSLSLSLYLSLSIYIYIENIWLKGKASGRYHMIKKD
jgi:hypothetical protein